jgi:putative transposase
MALKPGGFWRLRQSMTVRRAPRRPRSAASGFRSSGTGCCASTLAGPIVNGKSPGHPSKLNDLQRQAIAEMIERGPIPAVHGVVRWRLIDLAQWIFEEFRVTVAKQTLSRELRSMGYRKLSARPRHHAQAQGAIEDFKKASPRAWTQSRVRRRSASTR